MHKPIIVCPAAQMDVEGTKRSYSNSPYATAIDRADGILMTVSTHDLNSWEQILKRTACGVLIQGGVDIHPGAYHDEPTIDTSKCDLRRDEVERWVIQQACKLDIPLLGICRGLQIMNVACGGTLCQDLPKKQKEVHDNHDKPRSHQAHVVSVERDGSLYRAIGKHLWLNVNSLHHQAIERISLQLDVLARSKDGVIEAVGHTGNRFAIGVQWHPEELHDDPSAFLFSNFVQACRTQDSKV